MCYQYTLIFIQLMSNCSYYCMPALVVPCTCYVCIMNDFFAFFLLPMSVSYFGLYYTLVKDYGCK